MLAGAAEAVVVLPEWGRLTRPPGQRVVDKIRALEAMQYAYNLLFVHRDADDRDAARRYQEIHGANITPHPMVPVVPVQALEAWLLHDASAIRHAAGNPRGTAPLDLPSAAEIPRIADPKARLTETVRRAQTGASRRRLPTFNEVRRLLVDRLDLDGELAQQPSWRRLEEDLREAIASLHATRG